MHQQKLYNVKESRALVFDLLFDQNESKRTKQQVPITHQHMPMLVKYICTDLL